MKAPAGARLLTPTGNQSVKKPFGELTTQITVQGDQVTVKRSIRLDQLSYTPVAYKELRTLLNVWNDPNQLVLLFGK